VSYSLREPEWPAVCECRYDEARDEMDGEDCPFHCDKGDDSAWVEPRAETRRQPMRNDDVEVNESAA